MEPSLWGGCSAAAPLSRGTSTPVSLPGGFSASKTGGVAALPLDLPPPAVGGFLEKSNH